MHPHIVEVIAYAKLKGIKRIAISTNGSNKMEGVVFTPDNIPSCLDTIRFAHSLGVADIRIISAAQETNILKTQNFDELEQEILDAHPILNYRVKNFNKEENVRGMKETDCKRCAIVLDDSVIAGDFHYQCVIALREGAIGKVGPNMREERFEWFKTHDCFNDPICRESCLDVCIDYSLRVKELNENLKQYM